MVQSMESQSHALANTARVWDDALIDPRDTRDIVAFVLRMNGFEPGGSELPPDAAALETISLAPFVN